MNKFINDSFFLAIKAAVLLLIIRFIYIKFELARFVEPFFQGF